METEKTTGGVYAAPYIDTRISSDVSKDFSLADYYPEIKRIIFVTARAIPEGKFISGDQIDCDGIVSFNVTYLGEDSVITSVPLTVPYAQSASMPEAAGRPGEIICTSVASSPSCKVTSPRSITLRAKVETRIFCIQNIEAQFDTLDESGAPLPLEKTVTVEQKCIERPTVSLDYGAYSGELEGEITDRSCDRAVSADGIIDITDAKAQEGGVHVIARAIISLLCQDQNGIYITSKTTVPFETTVPVGEASPGDAAVASAVVTSVEVVMNDDGLNYLLEYDMDVQVAKTGTVTICGDAFSTEFESDAQTESVTVIAPVKVTNSHLTQSGELKRHGEASPGEYVISTVASAEADDISFADNKVKLSGTVNVCCAVSGENDVTTEEGKIPFTFVCDALCGECSPLCLTGIDVTDAGARLEGSSIIVTAELSISLCALGKQEEKAVCKMILHTRSPREALPGIRICFPSKDEEVWSICKKYGVSRRTLEKINGWQEGQLTAGTSPIIIE